MGEKAASSSNFGVGDLVPIIRRQHTGKRKQAPHGLHAENTDGMDVVSSSEEGHELLRQGNLKINDFVIRLANVNGSGSAGQNLCTGVSMVCLGFSGGILLSEGDRNMSAVTEAETIEQALRLSDSSRAKLAEMLIASLPGPFIDDNDNDGVEEALRRSREMDENPEMAISPEQLDAMIKKRFPQCALD